MRITLEHVDCDLCGSAKYRVRYRKPDDSMWLNQYEYPVVECVDCGLVYVNPRPTLESMAYFYPSVDRDNRVYQERYATELSYLPPLDGKRVLDIGCARGDFLARVKDAYPEAELYGVDPYVDALLVKDVPFFDGDLRDAALPAGHFDVVTAWAVFEHLHEPSAYFTEVARLLRDGGRFLLLVTNSESLYGRRAYVEDVPRHIYHYSEKTLHAYAKKSGLKVDRIVFDDRIWDGRGYGTIQYLLQRACGLTWEKIFLGEIHRAQRWVGKLGRWLDRLVFRIHWEAKLRRSGVMIAELVPGGAEQT